MRLQRVLLIGIVLLFILIPACSKSTPTLSPDPIAIPELDKPGATNTPSASGPADTPIPPGAGVETAYPLPADAPEPEAYPVPLEGKALMEARCTQCHTLDRVIAAKKDAAAWQNNVDRMIGKGAELSPEEAKVLVDYLAATYK